MSSSVRAGVIAVAAVALGLGLVGCGSDSETDATETTETTTSAAATTTGEAAPTTSPQAAGPHETIADYIRENGINEEPVKRDTPGAPAVDMPIPQGWVDSGPATPQWAYRAIHFADPAMGDDPPTIIAMMSKLTGNVDPAKVLELAPGEIQNLPGYQGADKGEPSQLGGFDAVQLGGMYTKDGVSRAIAQKTVVIPGENALYVLQLNADSREDHIGPLMDATTVIDQTTITP